MSSELIKLNTRGYNIGLDKLMDNKVDVYLKAKITKSLTYGKYAGELNNGFELLICDERKLLNLDNVEVFTCKDKPSLTDDQQTVLKALKADQDGWYPFFTIWHMMENDEISSMPTKQQFQVLAAFAEWGMEHEG